MLELKKHSFEGKNKEEVLEQALKTLHASTSEIYYLEKEEIVGGLFKSKKQIITAALKEDVLSYVKAYLKQITDLMNLTVSFETQKRETFIKINMFSDNNAILIGKNGKTISALQLLVRQAVQSQIGIRINIILDVEEYKEKQQENIERLAVKLARDVVRTKIEVRMDNMNSYERRLVHSALTDFKGVTTISDGEEPNRFVIIKPID
ncbi:MAG: RNA-binding cell elongation regulator Jag/EloR [Bacilli bacterium]